MCGTDEAKENLILQVQKIIPNFKHLNPAFKQEQDLIIVDQRNQSELYAAIEASNTTLFQLTNIENIIGEPRFHKPGKVELPLNLTPKNIRNRYIQLEQQRDPQLSDELQEAYDLAKKEFAEKESFDYIVDGDVKPIYDNMESKTVQSSIKVFRHLSIKEGSTLEPLPFTDRLASIFGDRKKMSVKEIINEMIQNTKVNDAHGYHNIMYNFISNHIGDFDVYIKPLKKTVRGQYVYSMSGERIELNIDGVNERVFLHELMHAATARILRVYESNPEQLTADQKNAISELQTIFSELLEQKPSLGKQYGFTNLDEFIAEFFSNDSFRESVGNMKLSKSYKIRYKLAELIGRLLGFLNFEPYTKKVGVVVIDRVLMLAQGNSAYNTDVEVELQSISQNEEWDIPLDQNGKQEDFYENSNTKERRKRITSANNGLLNLMANKTNTEDYLVSINYTEDEIKNNVEKVTTRFPNKKLTPTAFREELKKFSKIDQLQGSIRELLIQFDITKQQELKDKADRLIEELQQLDPEKVVDMSFLNRGSEFNVLDELYKKIGYTGQRTDVPAEKRNNMNFGVKVTSKTLGYMGTLDFVIDKPDGSVSFIEMKTGNSFLKEKSFVSLYLHGIAEGVPISNLNNAQLQLMWYMFLYKLQNPSKTISSGKILYANSGKTIESSDAVFELENDVFIKLIHNFLLDTKFLTDNGFPQDLYEKLEQEYIANGGKSFDELFMPQTYYNDSPEIDLNTSTLSADDIIEQSEKDILYNSKGLPLSKGSETIYKEQKETLANKALVVLRRYSSEALDYSSANSPFRLLYQMNDWNQSTLQAFSLYTEKNRQLYSKELTERLTTVENFRKKIFGSNMKGFVWNSKKTYGHLFTEHVVLDSEGNELRKEKRLLHANETDPENKARWNSLSPQEKEFLDYYHRRMKYYYHPETGLFAQKNINDITMSKQNISDIDVINKTVRSTDPFVYYEGWYPKVVLKDTNEISENLNMQGAKEKIKSIAKDIRNKFLLTEKKSEVASQPLALLYLGSPYALNNLSDIYSVDPFYALSELENANLYKKHMEKVFHVGRALTLGFSENTHTDRYGLATKTSEDISRWLKDWLDVNVLKLRSKTELSSPINFAKNKKEEDGSTKQKQYEVNVSGLVNTTTSLSANALMTFRIFGAVGNFTTSQMLNFRKRISNQVLKSLGTDESYLDYSFGKGQGYFKSNSKTVAYLKDSITGNLENNTMHHLALLCNIPVAFDVSEKMDNLVKSKKSSITSIWDKAKYSMLNASENANTVHMFSAYLHNIKVNGTPIINYYDMFEQTEDGQLADTEHNRTLLQQKIQEFGKENVDITLVPGTATGKVATYFGPIRFKQKISSGGATSYIDVRGLTTEEIAKAKAIYDRAHGEYRDKMAMEVNGLATMFTMLHRFFPRILKNIFEQRKSLASMGRYETVYDELLQQDVKVWVNGTVEGSLRMFVSLLMMFGTNGGINGVKKYWNTLDIEQKKHLMGALVGVAQWIAAYGIYVLAFSDDDDDNYIKKWFKRYTVDNPLQDINPNSLLESAKSVTVPVPVDILHRFTSGSTEIMFATGNYLIGNDEEAFTQRGDLRGWNNFKKTLPNASWAFDLVDKLETIGE